MTEHRCFLQQYLRMFQLHGKSGHVSFWQHFHILTCRYRENNPVKDAKSDGWKLNWEKKTTHKLHKICKNWIKNAFKLYAPKSFTGTSFTELTWIDAKWLKCRSKKDKLGIYKFRKINEANGATCSLWYFRAINNLQMITLCFTARGPDICLESGLHNNNDLTNRRPQPNR